MADKSSETLPARVEHGVITEIKSFVARLNELRNAAHLLSPVAKLDFIAPGYGISQRVVLVNPDKDAGEVYEPPGVPGKLALAKVALTRLDAAAGMRWVPSECGRVDNGTEAHYAMFRATAMIQDFDGTWRKETESKEVDLRDGSAQVKKDFTDKDGKVRQAQLAAARAHLHSLAESKAMNRVRRSMLGLRQSFAPHELQKPFVVFKLVPTPDMNDPEIRRIVTANSLGIAEALFGKATTEAVITPPILLHAGAGGPIRAIGEGEGAGEVPSGPPPTSAPAPTPDHRQERIGRIEALYRQKGITRGSDKSALADVPDEQLEKIEAALEAKPDAAKPEDLL